MKRILCSFMTLVVLAGAAQAQDKVVQTGTPAKIEVKGQQVPVFLQRLEDDKLTFQVNKRPKNITVPAERITRIEFVGKYDLEGFEAAFNEADYPAALAIMEPIMADVAQYMPIENNLRGQFVKLFECYWGMEDYANVLKHADMVKSLGTVEQELAQVALAAAKIAESDYDGAEAIKDAMENEAAQLYIEALILRAKGEYKEAIQESCFIILDHVYDMAWLPRAELLNTKLYLDMSESDTNCLVRAMNTGRQTKNMHKGGNIAGEAKRIWKELGGEPIEAAEKAARMRERAEELERQRARRAAIEKARAERERKKRAADEAKRRANLEAKAKAAKQAQDTTTDN